jgi:hypothetical protein
MTCKQKRPKNQALSRTPCDKGGYCDEYRDVSATVSTTSHRCVGSLSSMRKSPLSLQVCRSAWSSTMSSAMLATKLSVPLPPVITGSRRMLQNGTPKQYTDNVPVLACLSSKIRRHKPSRQQAGAWRGQPNEAASDPGSRRDKNNSESGLGSVGQATRWANSL